MWCIHMPDDNHEDLEVDQYQDELSEAVGDGGGCAETWDRLTSIREQATPDRRSVLKSIGAVGASSLGLSKIGVAASTEDLSEKEIKRALSAPSVKILLKDLNNPQIQRNAAKKVVPNVETKSEEYPSFIVLPTPIGDVVTPQTKENHQPALFKFNGKGEGARPKKYQQIPSGVMAGLIAYDGDITVTRGATQQEKRTLLNATRFDEEDENIQLVKTSEINGFRLFQGAGEKEKQSSEFKAFELELTDRDIRNDMGELFEKNNPTKNDIRVEKVELPTGSQEGDVSIQQSQCESYCLACLGTIGGACPACLTFLVFNIPGAIAFIGCFTLVCGVVLPVSCGRCLQCGT